MNGLFRPEWSTLKKLMFLQSASGGGYATIVGNPVTFTAKAAPLRKLEVAFSPVQEGTGDPSPDNVRPISGWSSLTVYHSGADTSNPQTISISLGSTVYSGYVDVVTGVGTVTHASETFDGTEAWGREALLYDTARFFLGKNEMKKYVDYTSFPYILFSNRMPTVRSYSDFADTKYLAVTGYSITSNLKNYVYVMSHYAATGIETVDQLKAWLANNPLQVCYELATPIPIQLTPQEVQSLLGENVLFSDANGDLTVEYRSN